MKFKGKQSILLLLVFMITVVALLTISMLPVVFPTQVVKADEYEDGIAADICIMINTNMQTSFVNWGGYYKCMGIYKGWIKKKE